MSLKSWALGLKQAAVIQNWPLVVRKACPSMGACPRPQLQAD